MALDIKGRVLRNYDPETALRSEKPTETRTIIAARLGKFARTVTSFPRRTLRDIMVAVGAEQTPVVPAPNTQIVDDYPVVREALGTDVQQPAQSNTTVPPTPQV